jgi:hypothetical protein
LSWKYWKIWSQVNKSFSNEVPSLQNWKCSFKWHISGAAGPNGSLSYTRYLDDLRSLSWSGLGIGLVFLFLALPYDNKRETYKALRDAFLGSLQDGDSNSIHSRLFFLSDKGGKTRVIAIGDILSQSLLKSVHQRCNVVLRRLKQDGTFDQDRSRCWVQQQSKNSVQLASIDLTAATDRMPALFQVFALISMRVLTPFQAFAWWWVTTRRDFIYKDKGSPKCTRYTVGQPMGLLSSWPVMALTHHYLVRLSFAASVKRVSLHRLRASPYVVLGDDLVIVGHAVAEEYLQLIQYLGMDYSVEKTYIETGIAEFAKSLFCHGEDLTPFPVALLRFNHTTVVSNTLAIITECERRNFTLTSATLLGLFPKRWRNLVLLAALSPKNSSSVLDLRPRTDHWIFLQFLLLQKIRYFSRPKTVFECTHAFALADPFKFDKRYFNVKSPFIQIGLDNGNSYPVRYLGDEYQPLVMMGSNWIAYNTKAWPNGLPSLGDESLIPGPTWKRDTDDKFFRSTLSSLNRLVPGYFHTRCVGKQVGE